MELQQLRCFIAVADTLHFGRAAQNLNMLPSALGRYIKLLEDDLGTRLLLRSTRNVTLTDYGALFLEEAKKIVSNADELQKRFQNLARRKANHLRIGAIDSAVAGLVPHILGIFRAGYPDIEVHITEDKTAKLLPKLKSGHLDLIFARLVTFDASLETRFLFYENIGLVVPNSHPLADYTEIRPADLADVALLVPEKKSRPHSYNLTMHLFEHTDIKPNLIQIADEKLTILNMITANLGVALMPRWATRMSALGVKFIPLAQEYVRLREKLPLFAGWLKHTRDDLRGNMMNIIMTELPKISAWY